MKKKEKRQYKLEMVEEVFDKDRNLSKETIIKILDMIFKDGTKSGMMIFEFLLMLMLVSIIAIIIQYFLTN